MLIIRKYKYIDWFDFLDLVKEELEKTPNDKDLYFAFLDELRMRRLESVSEGGSYKLKAPAISLKDKFLEQADKSSDFATEEDIRNIKMILADIL